MDVFKQGYIIITIFFSQNNVNGLIKYTLYNKKNIYLHYNILIFIFVCKQKLINNKIVNKYVKNIKILYIYRKRNNMIRF